ncbi:MAG: hypothetical protein JWR08_1935 [Enterovirga sp.]|nr:hypothetical protein [Enterovirga sp.]
MLFNSFQFGIFFVTFLVLFFGTPRAGRPVLLLIGSYIFYAGWRPSYLLLLLFTTLVDYGAARLIDSTADHRLRRIGLAASLVVNLGLLGTFKYLDFALASVVGTAGFFGVELPPVAVNLVLPVGISFYTFQSVGYIIDVYRRRFPAERSLLFYALYVAFFPQLVAGPIERASHMIAQYRAQRPTSPERVATGCWLIGWGLFKKICVADLVSPFVNGVYADPGAFNGSFTLLATVLFALQIYCDFSGYSDIAIGVARIMGFDLMINFRQPYFATSLTEFWRRWHISLSTWFRDYLYVPLGGSRTTTPLWVRNTLLVFAVSGLWHGANWTFLVWGLLHGLALVGEGLILRMRNAAAAGSGSARRPGFPLAALGSAYTLAVVLVGWVFFRARTMEDAVQVLRSWASPGPLSYGTFKLLDLPSVELLVLAGHVGVLVVVDGLLARRPDLLRRMRRSWIVATLAAVALFYDIALFGVFGSIDFVYFQF